MSIDPVENNLYELYASVAAGPMQELTPFRCIYQPPSSWPDMVFIPGETESLATGVVAELAGRIRTGDWSKTVVLREGLLSTEVQAALKAEGFMPVTQWTNMQLCRGEEKGAVAGGADAVAGGQRPLSGAVEVTAVAGDAQLKDWIGVAEKVLFNKKPLSAEIFERGMGDGSLRLLTAYYNGMAAGSGMIFFGTRPGVYMVATDTEHRRLGIGRMLMAKVHETVFASGDRVYLHATRDGLPFYTALGYTPMNKMILYYLRK